MAQAGDGRPSAPGAAATQEAKPIAEARRPARCLHSARRPRRGADLSPGGQAAHVGFDHDDLVLDGLAVWSLTWRGEEGPRVMPRPSGPPRCEQHAFTVYNADDGARTRFAAAELSNGVWGFYRWIVPADAASG